MSSERIKKIDTGTGTILDIPITGKAGREYSVRYISVKSGGDWRSSIQDPLQTEAIKEGILRVFERRFAEPWVRTVYPDRLDIKKRVTIIQTSEGEIVGAQIFGLYRLKQYPSIPKVLYTQEVALLQEHEGQGLIEKSIYPILDHLKPDVLAGTTANPAIIITNQRIAENRGMVFYPQANPFTVPEVISQFGKDILIADYETTDISLQGLVKTGISSHIKDNRPYSLTDALAPNQQILYLAFTQNLHEQLLGAVLP